MALNMFPPRLTMRSLIEAAAIVTGVPAEEITSRTKTDRLVRVRAVIAQVANQERLKAGTRTVSRWTMPRIAKALGYTDHTTVLNLLEKWERYCRIDPTLPEKAERTKAMAMDIVRGIKPGEPQAEPEEGQELVVVSIYTKERNDFRPEEEEEEDGSHRFHARNAKASLRFAEALRAAQRGAA
jgi:hypothetical protein